MNTPPPDSNGPGAPANSVTGNRAADTRSHSGAQLTSSRILGLALWFGLVTGLGEVALRAVMKFGFGQMLRIPIQFVWMAPVAEVVLFTGAALLLLLASLVVPRLRSARMVVLQLSSMMFLAWLLLIPWLSIWAVVLLSAGLAWRTSADLARSVAVRRPFHGAALGVTIVLLLALGLNGVLLARARAECSSLGDARSGVPNVLLIIWDTVRAESLSLYGHTRLTTPNLDRLAAGGVSFTKAISTSSWTLPAHASLFTGRLPHETSAAWYAPLDDTHLTLAERLRADGWETGGFAANVLYVEWEHGLARGFTHFEDYRLTPGQVMIASSLGRSILTGDGGWTPGVLRTLLGHHHEFIGRKWADQVNAALLDWLDEKEPDRPFFAFLNYFDAHLPYDPPAPFDTAFGPRRRTTSFTERLRNEWQGRNKWDLSDEDLAAEVRAYEASIAYLDDRLGRLLDSLDARGLLDRTLVVVTSDHGEEFGEHGEFEHGGNLYFEQTHVPLVLSWPGRLPEGMVIDTPVSIQDVPATIDRIARATTTRTFPGTSLTRFWDASGSVRASPVVAELVPGREPDQRMTSVIAAGFQYIADADSTIDLFDLEKDWAELNDLATTPGVDTIVERIRASAESFAACDSSGCCCTLPTGLFKP